MNMLYAERDIIKQGNFYTQHVSALTMEELYSKSDIAAELGHRDMQIAKLRAQLHVSQLHASNMFNAITMDNHALNEDAQTEADTALFNSTEDYAIWCEDLLNDCVK
jgi:hypothetical protein